MQYYRSTMRRLPSDIQGLVNSMVQPIQGARKWGGAVTAGTMALAKLGAKVLKQKKRPKKKKTVAREVMVKPSEISYGTQVSGGKKYSKRKVFQNKRLAKYSGAMKHILTEPQQLMSVGTFNLNNEGDSTQGKCGWYAYGAINPGWIDNILTGGSSTFAGGATGATGVLAQFECFHEQSSTEVQFRNNSNRDTDVTIWCCYPRKDLSSTVSGVSGANPQLLQDGFTYQPNFGNEYWGSVAAGSKAVAYNDYGSTPFQSNDWCRSFKLKQCGHKQLAPGETYKFTNVLKRRMILDKARYGLHEGQSISQAYTWLRDCGPILLVRVQGTLVHDESKVSYPLSNTSLNVSTSGWNIDCIIRRKSTIRIPYYTPQRGVSYTSFSLPTITRTNEQEYLKHNPAEQATAA